ncbi:MFS transporter [Streptomyces sp. NPDC021012]|uniref:MFS transporter n=1 Tax=Streptomyces sp. NPDC021012 TaxID=3365107 RepID=UPI003792E79D
MPDQASPSPASRSDAPEASATSATTKSTPAPSRLRTVIGTGVGNALEWYDWNVYAIFTPFFASQFFPSADPTSALLSTLAIFAVGFLMRPLGGLVFGRLSDRKGRRAAMVGSIALAAAGSLLIGLAPTYATIGVGASALLVFARLVQGLAHGGELPAAQTYVAEMAPRERRGLWSSLIYISGTCGIMVATVLAAVLSSFLSEDQLHAWGWRVPFVMGGLLGLYALIMRLRLEETDAFEKQADTPDHEPRTSVWRGFWENRAACLRVIGLTLGGTVVYYTWAVSAPAQAISLKGIEASSALWAGVLANLVFLVALPLFGALSDRVGRKPILYGSYIGGAVLAFPLNWFIQDQAWQLAVSMTTAMLFMSAGAAITPAVFAEMFPTRLRTTGAGFPYAIAVAACGGSAPYLQTWLASNGKGDLFLGYTVVLLLLALAVVHRMPETKNTDLT